MIGKCHVYVNEFKDYENDTHNIATEGTTWTLAEIRSDMLQYCKAIM